MKTWCTEIKAIDPIDGQLKSYAGPNVNAPTWSLADDYCQTHGLGYCKVSGQLIAEIPCKPGTYEADFSKQIDYDEEDFVSMN